MKNWKALGVSAKRRLTPNGEPDIMRSLQLPEASSPKMTLYGKDPAGALQSPGPAPGGHDAQR